MALRALRNSVFASVLGGLMASMPAVGADTPDAAAVVDTAALVKQVEAKYADVSSLKAVFTQTARSELFGDEVSKGNLVVARPAKMRWEFGSEKLFVTDGKKMWIYTAEDRQVIEYDDVSATPASADSLLTSLDKLDEHFKVKVLASSEAGHELELMPLEEDGPFKKVRLKLDGDLMVSQVVITDAFDNETDIEFSGVELNAKTDDSMFTFEVPAGVDVVKATTN